MNDSHFFKKKEIEQILNSIINQTLGNIDKNGVFKKTITNPKITGIAGDVIEQSVLGFPADNKQRPDLNIDGMLTELKTLGVKEKRTKEGIIFDAKEPLTITAVSLSKISKENFYESNFWHKIKNLLFVFYHYESSTSVSAADYSKFHIKNYCFYEFSSNDIEILKNDWQKIHDFVLMVQTNFNEDDAKLEYPKLSSVINKQTDYIDTSPKYPNSPRFRIRRRIISIIVDQVINKKSFERLPDKYLCENDFIRKCNELTNKYHYKSVRDLLNIFNIELKNTQKNYSEEIIVKMFGGKGKKISEVEEFRKFGYVGKSFTISKRENRTEDLKLLKVDFSELSQTSVIDEDGNIRNKEFEDSVLYNYLVDTKIIFIMFKENTYNKENKPNLFDNQFIGFKILDLASEEFVEEARKSWVDARFIINSDNLKFVPSLNKKREIRINKRTGKIVGAPNLPKSINYNLFFRGSGKDSTSRKKINNVEMLSQYYWIKGKYIVDELKKVDFL